MMMMMIIIIIMYYSLRSAAYLSVCEGSSIKVFLIFNCECFALCDYICSLIIIFSNTCSKDLLIKQFTLDTSCCTLVINVKFGVYLSTYSVSQCLCKIIQGF